MAIPRPSSSAVPSWKGKIFVARFILVHGAWHGGWCWEEIVPRLAALGHQVCAPDLPGMGADAISGHVATLEEWAMFIAGMASAAAQPAILMGHSRGGIVISRAAELVPWAISDLVYLAAVMATPGQCMNDLFTIAGEEPKQDLTASIAVSADGRTTRWHVRDTAIAAFYGLTPREKAEAAFARLTPEPASMRMAPVMLSASRYGRIDRHYIHCTQDKSVSPELQREMVARQSCATYTLNADHSPFYSTPEQLVETIDHIASSSANSRLVSQ